MSRTNSYRAIGINVKKIKIAAKYKETISMTNKINPYMLHACAYEHNLSFL